MSPLPLLRHLTLLDTIAGLERRLFTSVDRVDAYLARIREVDLEFRSVVQVSLNAASQLKYWMLSEENREGEACCTAYLSC